MSIHKISKRREQEATERMAADVEKRSRDNWPTIDADEALKNIQETTTGEGATAQDVLQLVEAVEREAAPDKLHVHLQHCNFGEHAGACKYGDADCPALTETWEWFGVALQQIQRCDDCGVMMNPIGKGIFECWKCVWKNTGRKVENANKRADEAKARAKAAERELAEANRNANAAASAMRNMVEQREVAERDYKALRELFESNPKAWYSQVEKAEARARSIRSATIEECAKVAASKTRITGINMAADIYDEIRALAALSPAEKAEESGVNK